MLRALASKVADVAEYQQNALRELWNDGAEGERAEPDVVANAVVAKMLRALGKSFVSEEEQLAEATSCMTYDVHRTDRVAIWIPANM